MGMMLIKSMTTGVSINVHFEKEASGEYLGQISVKNEIEANYLIQGFSSGTVLEVEKNGNNDEYYVLSLTGPYKYNGSDVVYRLLIEYQK